MDSSNKSTKAVDSDPNMKFIKKTEMPEWTSVYMPTAKPVFRIF